MKEVLSDTLGPGIQSDGKMVITVFDGHVVNQCAGHDNQVGGGDGVARFSTFLCHEGLLSNCRYQSRSLGS